MRINKKSLHGQVGLMGAASVMSLLAGAAHAQSAPAAPAAAPTAQPADIVVTGFRRSLEQALSVKRTSVGAVDAIVAEDIAKFPDQNLAESLQRVPGIAITRDGGEGREITVRGLSGQFTTVRVNGMVAQASTYLAGSGGGVNNNRSFDFNQFGSELFRNLVVHKTAEASLDEGSLGAVVDLNTGHPLGGKAGFHGALNVQGAYNDLAKFTGPKSSGLINWKNGAGTFAVNVSAAYSHTKALELGDNTTRWGQAIFNSVTLNGTTYNCFTKVQNKSATPSTYIYNQSAACDQAALSFHPRIPRYGTITHDRERQGYTGAIEWQPTSKTHAEIDGIYSFYHEIRTEQWAEILFRNDESGINVVNPTYDSNGNMISGTFSGQAAANNTNQAANYFERHENYYQDQRDKFYQFSGHLDQQFGNHLKAVLSGGFSRDDQATPIATTLMLDNPTASGYSYNYTNMASPVLTFGTDPTNPNNYVLDEIRDRPTDVINKFKTGKLDFDWEVDNGIHLRAGGFLRQFDFQYISGKRDSVACVKGASGFTYQWGALAGQTCAGTNAGYALSAYPAITTDLITLGNNGQPAGTSNQFVVADLASGTTFSGLYNRASDPSTDPTNNRSVRERERGFYIQFDARGNLEGLEYAMNAGMRYISTNTNSEALQAVVTCTNPAVSSTCTTTGYNQIYVPGTYDNWLPSVNLNFFPTKKIIMRLAAARTITRPSLPSLSPNATVDQFNYKISFGNPNLQPAIATNYDAILEWYFAPQSIAAVGVFQKNVQNGTTTTTTTGTYASSGLPLSALTPGTPGYNAANGISGTDSWTITSIQNSTSTSTIKGLELNLQMPFRFLPGVLKHFGLLANLTLTDSSSTNGVTGAATSVVNGVAGTATKATSAASTCPQPSNGTTITTPATGGLCPAIPTSVATTYVGASKSTWNATLYYEDSRFGARVSYSYRGPYLDSTSATNGNIFDGFTAYKSVDASVRFSLTKFIDLTLDGNNLLDQYVYHYTDAVAQRNYENYHTGRNIVFGARMKF